MSALLPVLVSSVVGSLHCVGMCGGIVTLYSSQSGGNADAAASASRWAAHGTYHLARLVAYAGLGAAAGQLGAAFDGVGRSWGFAALGSLLATGAVLCWALPQALGPRGRAKLVQLGLGPARKSRWRKWMEPHLMLLAARARQRPPLWRAGALGLSSALLPCGWLYTFVFLAAGAGSAWAGVAMLAAFWLGTVPALLGLGVGMERLSRPLRARLPRLGAVLVLLVAVWNIALRWPAPAAGAAAPTSSATPSCHVAH